MSRAKGNKSTKPQAPKTSRNARIVESYSPEESNVNVIKRNNSPIEPKTASQADLVQTIFTHDIIFVSGCAGTGKTWLSAALAARELDERRISNITVSRPAVEVGGEELGFLPGPQPLDAKVLTPSGWVQMGDIKIGDKVIARDGSPTEVLGVFPKGEKEVYRVITTDGSSTECCEDHLWFTRTFEDHKRGRPGSVKSTKQIMDTMVGYRGKINHYIPRNEAVQFSKVELPIPPYTLGVLIGDGCMRGNVSIASTDRDIIDRVSVEVSTLGIDVVQIRDTILYSLSSKRHYNNKVARPILLSNEGVGDGVLFSSIGVAVRELGLSRGRINHLCKNELELDGYEYRFMPRHTTFTNRIKEQLHKLGLHDKNAWEKFIPDLYKYAAIEDRVELLRGLMDTDGTIKKNGEASFTTTSPVLAADMQELIRSLGGRATLCKRDRVGRIHTVNGIEIVTRRASYEFTISMPGHINPFHLSRKASRHKTSYVQRVGISSIEFVGKKEVQCIRVDHPEHLYLTDEFIVTHNTMEEKFAPWFEPFRDVLEERLGTGALDYHLKRGNIEAKPLGLMRGKSYKDKWIILDEAQNTTPGQMKMFLTRLGEGSKMIILGDVKQSDIKTTSGMSDAIRRLKGVKGIAHHEFTREDIVRHDLVAKIISRYEDD